MKRSAPTVAALVMTAILGVPASLAGNVSAKTTINATSSPSSIADASVVVSSASAAATAVTYSITFLSPQALHKGTSIISLVLPNHASLPVSSCDSDWVTDDATELGSCGNLSVTGNSVTIKSPIGTGPGDEVTVRLNGIVNPATPGLKKLSVSTSSDPTRVHVYFGLNPPTSVAHASVQLSSDSASATRATYSLTFQSPDRFESAVNQTPSITIKAPFGTVFPPGTCGAYEFIDDTQSPQGGCGPTALLTKAGSTVTFVPPTTGPGDVVSVVIRGVTNSPKAGLHSLLLSTSADPKPVPVTYSLMPTKGVAYAFLQKSSYASSAKGATWSVGFSSPDRLTGFSSATGDSAVTVQAPAGTVFPPFTGCNNTYLFVDPLDGVDHCVGSAHISAGGSRLVVQPLEGVTTPGAVMALVVAGVTNSAGGGRLQVWTTSDPSPVPLPTAQPTLPPAGVQLDSTSAKATMVTYAASFALKGTFNAANCPSGGSKITLTGPSGTIFPTSGYMFYDLANGSSSGAAACPPTGTTYTPGSTVPLATTIASGAVAVKPGDYFAVVATSVANASSAGPHNLGLVSSTGAAAAPKFNLTAPRPVSAPLLSVLSDVAGATGVHYAVTFVTSGGLLPDASSIALSMPGIAWGPGGGNNDGWAVYDDTTGLAGVGYASYGGKPANPDVARNPGPAVVDPSTGDGFRTAAGDIVTVAADGVYSPTASGAHQLTLSTSADPVSVKLPLTLHAPTPARLPVLDLTPPQAGAKNATFALTFVSGGGLTPHWSTISMAFRGVTWAPGVGDGDGFAVYDDTTQLAGGGYGNVNGTGNFNPLAGNAVAMPSTGDGFYGSPGDTITVLVTPVVNPPGPGLHTLSFASSADPAIATAKTFLK